MSHKSALQMIGNPQIIKFNFERLNDYNNMTFEININNIIKDEQKTSCKVVQHIQIFSKEEKSPFIAEVIAEAKYEWEDDTKDENREMFMKYSAPSTILAYIRPIITQVLIYSGLPDFRLPIINMFNVVNENEKKQENK